MGHSFNDLSLSSRVLQALQKLGLTTPTPIQQQSIPSVISGKDIVGIAQTGTGKTLAYGLPLVELIIKDTGSQGLILVPTRELALQVDAEIHKVSLSFRIQSAVLIGGASMYAQKLALRRGPRIVIATPGRLLDHLEQKTISLSRVRMLVLDEADRMLDMGFQPQMKRILELVPKDRQTLLFSATLSSDIMAIATKHMKMPLRVEIAPAGTTADRVTQELFFVTRDDKSRLLEKLLYEHTGSTLVFTRTKHMAKRIMSFVRSMGHTTAELHGNRSLNQRIEALAGFKNGKYRVLVATDIAARGIDVKDVKLIINFDLPMQSEDYVHRIGRTARAGAEGHAISFVLPEEKYAIRSIERLIRKTLRVSKLPELPPARNIPRVEEFSNRRGALPRRFSSERPSRPLSREGGPRPHSHPSSSHAKGSHFPRRPSNGGRGSFHSRPSSFRTPRKRF